MFYGQRAGHVSSLSGPFDYGFLPRRAGCATVNLEYGAFVCRWYKDRIRSDVVRAVYGRVPVVRNDVIQDFGGGTVDLLGAMDGGEFLFFCA